MLACSPNLLFSTAINRIHSPRGDLYIAHKACLGPNDGKTFECGRLLKHSLRQGYNAGWGRNVSKALVKDTPKWQLLQANII
jgi:hypothetical protein